METEQLLLRISDAKKPQPMEQSKYSANWMCNKYIMLYDFHTGTQAE
jgi:hypothetical protein